MRLAFTDYGSLALIPKYLLVTKLNDVRDDTTTYNNRLDTTLADVFSLLSLFYLTIGKTRDTPATYSQIASMRVSLTYFASCGILSRLAYESYSNATLSLTFPRCKMLTLLFLQQILNHMNESAVYNESDLAPFHRRLNELRQIVQHGTQDGKSPDAVTKLLERQLNECGA